MVDSVVTEQENALKDIIEYLSKKYGIDIHGTSIGHRECKKDDCLLDDYIIPNLTGHREIGFTSCPGDGIFVIIEDIRKSERASIGRNMVMNPYNHSIQLASLSRPESIDSTLKK